MAQGAGSKVLISTMARDMTNEDTERGERMKALRIRLGLVGREIFPDDPVNSHARVSAIEKGRNRLTGSDAILAYAKAASVSSEDIVAYRDGLLPLDTLLDRQRADVEPTAVEVAFLRLARTDPDGAANYLTALTELRKQRMPADMRVDEAEALLKEWVAGTRETASPKVARRR